MHADHIASLKKAAASQKQNRWLRLLRSPIGTGGPYALRALRTDLRAEAETFFGRRQSVVLPELVSVQIWRYGFFEMDVAYQLLSTLRPGDVFLDVGAHFGFFSMLGAEIVGEAGTVVSFEPMPANRGILETNMARNAARCTRHVVPAAAGRVAGRLTFKDFGLLGAAFATSKQVRSDDLDQVGEIEVDVTTVDRVVADLKLSRVDVIKIDAENAEDQVIAGAGRTIETMKPSLIVETGDDGESRAHPILEDLMARGYAPFEFEDFSLKPHAVTGAYGYQNLLLVHRDRQDGLRGLVH